MTLAEIIANANANSEFIPGMSSNEMFFGTSTNDRLTDVIADVADACQDKADSDHTHSGYAPSEHSHSGYAPSEHSHEGYAPSEHSHNYAATNHSHSYNDLSDKPTIPTIPASLPANGGNADTVGGKSASDFAPASHSHSYAAANHTHTAGDVGAVSADGGTINGDVNVAGVIRTNGQQAFYYAPSTNSQTVGTNNATGGTTIACGSEATVNVNGGLMKTPTVVPRSNNLCYCGNSNLRWKGIYSTAAVNVSSDERLKRDIAPMDGADLAAFIEKLNVVSYNYKDDAEDAKARIGLIAQDVQRADADLAKFFVSEDETGMLGLTPADLVFPLIAAVQALSKRVAELEAK